MLEVWFSSLDGVSTWEAMATGLRGAEGHYFPCAKAGVGISRLMLSEQGRRRVATTAAYNWGLAWSLRRC